MPTVQASNNASFTARGGPHWPWDPPEGYHGRAGYRDDFSVAAGAPATAVAAAPTFLHPGPRRLADSSRPPTPPGSRPPYGWGNAPLSGPLPASLCLPPDPVPAAPSVGLAIFLPPGGRTTGLPRCAAATRGG